MRDFLAPDEGWISCTPARLPPPPVTERGLPFRAVSKLSSLFGRGQLPDEFPAINTRRGLFWAWLWFASRLMPFGKLPARERELLILRNGVGDENWQALHARLSATKPNPIPE